MARKIAYLDSGDDSGLVNGIILIVALAILIVGGYLLFTRVNWSVRTSTSEATPTQVVAALQATPTSEGKPTLAPPAVMATALASVTPKATSTKVKTPSPTPSGYCNWCSQYNGDERFAAPPAMIPGPASTATPTPVPSGGGGGGGGGDR